MVKWYLGRCHKRAWSQTKAILRCRSGMAESAGEESVAPEAEAAFLGDQRCTTIQAA
jgi:hypothetical protein